MSWLAAHAALLVVLLLVLPTAAVLLSQRRSAQSALGWLLALFVLPYLALPLYWALGFRKRRAGYPPLYLGAQREAEPAAKPATPSGDPTAIFAFQGAAPLRTDGMLDLLADGPDAWAALTRLARDEADALDVMIYLIANDPVGTAFVDLLTDRVRAGVRVRLMVDRLGGFSRPRAALRAFEAAGGELRYASPFLHKLTETRLNLRNHRKLLIAGGRAVLAGGMNVGADYLGPNPDGPERFVDLSFVLHGTGVRDYAAMFAADWAAAGRKRPSDAAGDVRPASNVASDPDAPGSVVSRLVASGPDVKTDVLHDGLVATIHRAQRRVWLTTPYFTPAEAMMEALGLAARRGLDVRLLVPRRSNHRPTDIARGPYLRSLQAEGACLLFHETRMVHAKVGVIDDLAWVGSANLDARSMLLNFESALFLTSSPEREAVAAWFEALRPACGTALPPAGPARRVLEGVFRLGTPLM